MTRLDSTLLQISGLKKSFIRPDGTRQRILDVPEFIFSAGAHIALAGESGGGKTIFLNLIAGILQPDTGEIIFNGTNLTALSEPQRDRFRAQNLGYIFQTFNLLQSCTCLENVLLGMTFGAGLDRPFAEKLLRQVGLGDRLHHHPRQLSVGQQQRVAIARALANRPKLVLADEPTGNLDPKNSRIALALIRDLCAESGAALLLVSHDRDVLAEFDDVQDFHCLNFAAQEVTT